MEHLLVSFRVVAPLMVYMAVGVLLKRFRIVDAAGFRGANRIVYHVALPALCVRSVAAADLAAMRETPFLLYVGLGLALLFALSMLLVPRFSHEDARRGVLVLSIFRSNEALFGLSVASALLGEDRLTYMTLAASLSVLMCNLLSVFAMERYNVNRASLGRTLLQILKNPVVLGCVIGLALNLAGLRLPDILDAPLSRTASIATPLAFIALGGTLSFGSIRRNRAALASVSLLRLVAIPAVFVLAFWMLGFPKDAIATALILFGAPSAMVMYNMAVIFGADEELAGSIVAVTSVLSMATMFLFLYALGSLGVI